MRGREPPLVAGGQGRSAGEVILGARVVALCAAGVLTVVLARVMGAV